MAPRETENNAYAKFGVTNKEHYGMLWYFLVWSILTRNARVFWLFGQRGNARSQETRHGYGIDVVCEEKNTSINLYEQNPFFEFCFLYQLVIKQTATQSVFLRIQVRASSQTKGLELGRITDFEKKTDCFAV